MGIVCSGSGTSHPCRWILPWHNPTHIHTTPSQFSAQAEVILSHFQKILVMHTLDHIQLIHRTGVLKKKEPKNVNLLFLHQMLPLKMYVQKMCYSSTMPSRKQSHYRYQNENLHLLSHLGHVFFNSHQILSPNWDTEQRAGLFHCSWSEHTPPLGTRYSEWSPLISWILLKAVHLLPFVKETLLQTWACACFVQSNTEPAWSLLESSC